MPDQFDLQRERDGQAQAMVDEAMDKLDECRDKVAEREERLIHLHDVFYFDPKVRCIVVKNGTGYANLDHNPDLMRLGAAALEQEAHEQGYTAISGGLFWDSNAKRVFVKNGGHYVLYSLDRRKDGAPEANMAVPKGGTAPVEHRKSSLPNRT